MNSNVMRLVTRPWKLRAFKVGKKRNFSRKREAKSMALLTEQGGLGFGVSPKPNP